MANQRIVWSTDKVEQSLKLLNTGYILKPNENPFYEGKPGMGRKGGIYFQFTPHELEERVKCAQDIYYFAENYCKIKTGFGAYELIQFRDYQVEIMEMLKNNQKSILMASRQVGKCFSFNTELIIRNNKTGNEKNVKFYQLLFQMKIKKTLSDYLKHGIYFLIDKIS